MVFQQPEENSLFLGTQASLTYQHIKFHPAVEPTLPTPPDFSFEAYYSNLYHSTR